MTTESIRIMPSPVGAFCLRRPAECCTSVVLLFAPKSLWPLMLLLLLQLPGGGAPGFPRMLALRFES